MRASRRLGSAILGLVLIGAFAPTAVAEGPEPRIFDITWLSRPLTAGAVEVLELRAIDPDGVVTTADVYWGDGGLVHADLICLDPGQVATVRLTYVYSDPGLYRVRARVMSGPRCFTVEQTSPVARVRAPVRP